MSNFKETKPFGLLFRLRELQQVRASVVAGALRSGDRFAEAVNPSAGSGGVPTAETFKGDRTTSWQAETLDRICEAVVNTKIQERMNVTREQARPAVLLRKLRGNDAPSCMRPVDCLCCRESALPNTLPWRSFLKVCGALLTIQTSTSCACTAKFFVCAWLPTERFAGRQMLIRTGEWHGTYVVVFDATVPLRCALSCSPFSNVV